MLLYHGSTIDIREIDLRQSKPNKDFGCGFYLSDDRRQAMDMAEFKAFQIGGTPVLNVYEFDENLLHAVTFKVKTFEGYSKEWAQFVFENRNAPNGDSVHDYDIVYGPIANDRVGLQIRRYMEKEITFDTFLERLKYMKGVTYQYFFGTERAITQLRKL
ncbi:MAG: DUF3990 domain-containing protein [Bacteroidaceae bacterium]|nr:DUF3990 domain-containing protein [Bacteroidaceae bacterium]